jgi:heat shock protein HtpX
MSNLYKVREKNVFKTWTLMAVFLVLVIFLGWFISIYYNSPGILLFAVIFSIGMNFVSYWYSDKIVLKISGAREAKKEEFYDLYTTVENLAITAGLPMPKVYVINDPAPNAFATGRNEEHATLAFTTGLLGMLEKVELEGVIAHELAHVKNKDILLQTIVVVLVGLITLLADWFIRISFYGGDRRDSGKLGLILMIVGIVLIILSPVIATIIQLAISRKREFMADASGALLTRYPDGLASALNKISGYKGGLKRPNHATAHLYISDPYGNGENGKARKEKKQKKGFFHKLFLTHPPVEERIGALVGNE